MSGLNNGYKYMYSHNATENKKEDVGVFFGKKSGKWIVNIENKTKSKYMRPIITIAQFDTKEKAEEYFNNIEK